MAIPGDGNGGGYAYPDAPPASNDFFSNLQRILNTATQGDNSSLSTQPQDGSMGWFDSTINLGQKVADQRAAEQAAAAAAAKQQQAAADAQHAAIMAQIAQNQKDADYKAAAARAQKGGGGLLGAVGGALGDIGGAAQDVAGAVGNGLDFASDAIGNPLQPGYNPDRPSMPLSQAAGLPLQQAEVSVVPPSLLDKVPKVPLGPLGDTRSLAAGATSPLSLALLGVGGLAQPVTEPAIEALGGGALANIGVHAAENAAIGAGLTGLNQAATGQFSPSGLLKGAAGGAILGAGGAAIGQGISALRNNPIEPPAEPPAAEPVEPFTPSPDAQTVYHGTNGPLNGPLAQDAFVTPNYSHAQTFANAATSLGGGEPVVHTLSAEPGSLRPMDEPGYMQSQGGMQVSDPSGLRQIPAVQESGVANPPSFTNEPPNSLDQGNRQTTYGAADFSDAAKQAAIEAQRRQALAQPEYTGPQPGHNLVRPDEDQIKRGAAALQSRLRLEVAKGLSPDAAHAASQFIDSLPPEYVQGLGSSYTAGGTENNGLAVAGTYHGNEAIINIAKSVVDATAQPERVIVHEISHHLEQFVSPEDYAALRDQWQREMGTQGGVLPGSGQGGQALLDAQPIIEKMQAAQDLKSSAPRGLGYGRWYAALTPDEQALLTWSPTAEESALVNSAYRYNGGFGEWFAEKITDNEIQRQAATEGVTTPLGRAWNAVKGLAQSAYNFLLRRGEPDAAARVHSSLLAGTYGDASRVPQDASMGVSDGQPNLRDTLNSEEGSVANPLDLAHTPLDPAGLKGKLLGNFVSPVPVPTDPYSSNEAANLGRSPEGLTKAQQYVNDAAQKMGKPAPFDEQVTPIIKDKAALQETLRSQGVIADNAMRAVQAAFKPDKNGFVRIGDNPEPIMLEDVAKQIAEGRASGTPSPLEQDLTPKQLDVLTSGVDAWTHMKGLADTVGVDLGDTHQGYLPRGDATPPGGVDEVNPTGPKGLKGRRVGPEQARVFDTRQDAIAEGYTYPSLVDASRSSWRDLSNRITTQQFYNDLQGMRDENGNPVFTKIKGQMARGNGSVTGMEGYEGPADVVNMANKALQTPSPPLGPIVHAINQGAMQIKTIADFASPVRVALNGGLALHPTQFAQAFADGIQSIVHDSHMGDAIAAHDANIGATGEGTPSYIAVRDGLKLSGFRTGGLSGVPVLGPMQRFISAFLDSYRLGSYDDALDMQARQGRDITDPAVRQEVAHALNRVTGTSTHFGSGYLNDFVMFPQWVGSQLDQINKAITDGGIAGSTAREAFAKTLGGAIAVTYALNYYQGNKTQWQDGSPILALPGGVKIHMLGSLGTIAKTVELLSPVSLDKDHTLQDPLKGVAYFATSKAAPGPAALLDLINQARGNTPYNGSMGSLNYWARNVAPYSVSNLTKSTFTSAASAANAALGAAGFRSTQYPPTQFQDAAKYIDQQIRTQFASQLAKQSQPGYDGRNDPNYIAPAPGHSTLSMASLNDQQKAAMKLTPQGKTYEAQINAAAAKSPQPPNGIDTIKNAIAIEATRHANKLQALDATFAKNKDGVAYRKAVAEESTQHITAEQNINALSQQTPVGATTRNPVTGKMQDNLKVSDVFGATHAGDQAVNAYYALYDKATSPDGTLDFDKLNQLQKQFLGGLDPQTAAYVNSRLDELKNKGTVTDASGNVIKLPGLQALEQAKTLTAPYWQVPDTVFTKYQQEDPTLQGFKSYSDFKQQMVQAALAQNMTLQQFLPLVERQDRFISKMTRDITKEQKDLRGNNPAMDYALQTYYGSPATNQKGYIATLAGDTSYNTAPGAYSYNPLRKPLNARQLQRFSQQYSGPGFAQGTADLFSQVFGLNQ